MYTTQNYNSLTKIRKEKRAGNCTQNSGRLVSGITAKLENSEMYAWIYLQRVIEIYNETEIENKFRQGLTINKVWLSANDLKLSFNVFV